MRQAGTGARARGVGLWHATGSHTHLSFSKAGPVLPTAMLRELNSETALRSYATVTLPQCDRQALVRGQEEWGSGTRQATTLIKRKEERRPEFVLGPPGRLPPVPKQCWSITNYSATDLMRHCT